MQRNLNDLQYKLHLYVFKKKSSFDFRVKYDPNMLDFITSRMAQHHYPLVMESYSNYVLWCNEVKIFS